MSVTLPVFNYFGHCQPCLACCEGENLYLDDAERARIDAPSFSSGKCQNLADDGRCKVHEHRPNECRLYPLDIKRVDEVVSWLLWKPCPSAENMPASFVEQEMSRHEATLTKAWVDGYVSHHEVNEPKKYASMFATVLRTVNLTE